MISPAIINSGSVIRDVPVTLVTILVATLLKFILGSKRIYTSDEPIMVIATGTPKNISMANTTSNIISANFTASF